MRSTVNNFHQSDDATVFFGSAPVINTMWADNEGAPGYTGLTLARVHAERVLDLARLFELRPRQWPSQYETDGTAYMHIIGTG